MRDVFGDQSLRLIEGSCNEDLCHNSILDRLRHDLGKEECIGVGTSVEMCILELNSMYRLCESNNTICIVPSRLLPKQLLASKA